ncbi:hypothetical protein SLE2022_248230 [Rubroshorea leprosula]
MEAIGTTALSVSLDWLIDYLGSKLLGWWNQQEQVGDDLQNWKSLLPKIRVVLDDAEKRQTADPAVETWLSDLRDLAYDMEDVFDGIEADERRKELTAKTDQPSTSKKQKWIQMCTGFNQDDLILDHEAVSKIKEISVRLERIVGGKEALDLKVGEARSSIAASRWEPTSTTWLLEIHVYGREGDKDAILQKVLNDEDGDENPHVIPIVGMGGLGKTTLARLVYNDAKLKGVFEHKAWVCVSDEFDILRITISIIEQITQKKYRGSKDPSVIQGELYNMLSGKKFLLVLDDAWSEDNSCWDELQRVFVSAAVGSKIIVTSRSKGVAKAMRATDQIYPLEELPQNHCLSLLARQALGRENFDANAHLHLKDIAEEIVKRCRGLPLAVKTLGGVLYGELDPKTWVKILNSEIWELPEESSRILPALRLSYHHLPAPLKRCFAYCAVFPKDYIFDKDDLVLLWMAEGFVKQQQNGARQMKDMGDQYFRDLISRGLFQQSTSYGSDQLRFVMHDLVHDLAQYIAGETCCNFGNLIQSEKEGNFEKARYVSCIAPNDLSQFLQKPNNWRTLLVLDPHYAGLHNESFPECLQKLRCLRVLSLNGWRISELPNSIEKLKHLRYLNLSGSALQCLPNSVRSLVYLQTMILHNCYAITELPAGIVDLVDLHHLDIRGTSSLQKMPSLMGNLKNLLMLPKFIVGESGGLRLKELSNLKGLRGKLLIKDLHNVSDFQDASKANLFNIEGLEELTLAWTNDFQTSRDESFELQVLGQLKPHFNLKRLKIDSYGGLEFPSWMGDPSFSKLECLGLNDCKRSTLLPRLGQLPQLMRLEIYGCPQLTNSPMSLQSLQELYLQDCRGAVLRSVFDSAALTKLSITRISELTCLPRSITQNMTTLEALDIDQCGELVFLLEDGDSLSSFSSLKKMYITGCPLLESLTDLLPLTLETLTIMDCDNLERLPNGLHRLSSLKELDIQGCKKFVGLPVTDFPLHLQRLLLNNLEALESLPDELMMTTETSDIYHCPRLKSFSTGELLARLEESTVENSEKSEFLREGDDSSTVTVNLERTSVSGLGKLNFPIDCVHNLGRLCYLLICDCKSLESLPERLLSTSTPKTLVIRRCDNLKSLPNGMDNCTSLHKLIISDCPAITSIAGGGLPPNLKELEIDCEGLKQSTR